MKETLSLKEFIAESLSEICSAIEETREKYSYIAPKHYSSPMEGTATMVSFDMAVTVENAEATTDASGKTVGGGLKINIIKAEASLDEESSITAKGSQSNVNRIQFNVPVYFRLNEEAYERKLSKIPA